MNIALKKLIANYSQRNDENHEKRMLLTLLGTINEMKLRIVDSKKQSIIATEHWSILISYRKGGILFSAEARIYKFGFVTILRHRCKSSSVRK